MTGSLHPGTLGPYREPRVSSALRDEFAKAALIGFMQTYPDHFENDTRGADYCYRVADAMIAAREKTKREDWNPIQGLRVEEPFCSVCNKNHAYSVGKCMGDLADHTAAGKEGDL